ncbi:MAG TPA: FHA domain-containing protein, partial [Polyangia bacterium]
MSDATTIDATRLDAPSAGIPSRAYLVVRENEHSQIIDVDEGDAIVIGRSSAVTVHIEDAKASREHARVSRRGGILRIIDLGSRNGTRLNQEVLRGEERPLRSGDVVRIGAVEIFVAESTATAGEGGEGARLESELKRLRANTGGRAALVRVAGTAQDLARMAPALAAAALVEAQGAGEWACLFGGDVAARVDELRRLAPPGGPEPLARFRRAFV